MTARWLSRSVTRPLVFGHRGSPRLATENTLRSFAAAQEAGADGLEFDVRLDGSGRVVVFHDPELTRMTKGADQRRVEDIACSALDEVRLLGHEPIPSLAAVLDWARLRDLRLNIELKPNLREPARLAEAVLGLLEGFPDAPARVGLSSFDSRLVMALSRRQSRLSVGWLVEHTLPSTAAAGPWRALGANSAHPQWTLLDGGRVAALQSQGLGVVTWTVDELPAARKLADWGVDAIISNLPGRLLLDLRADANG
jgi:glycerophosphoryl diester phosphodiesterase